MDFTYDDTGTPLTLSSGDEVFYYITNLQGDVTGLVDQNGMLCIQYTYDAWGNFEITNVNNSTVVDNPLTYRGYIYDHDAGLYYLQSRYYDPNTGRFLNADAFTSTGQGFTGNNMFAYCGNNPVIRFDPTGRWFGIDDLVAGAVGAVVGIASQFVSDVVDSAFSGSWHLSSWETYLGAGFGGAAGGIATLYGGPVVGSAIAESSSTLIGQVLENATGEQKRSVSEIVGNATGQAAIGAILTKYLPIKVPGITSGRNSMAAVYQSGITKLRNKTASKMSQKVAGKGIISGFVGDLSISIVNGIIAAIEQ